MESNKEVILNGINFKVQFDIDEMKQTLHSLENSFEGQYMEMYSVDKTVTEEQFKNDIELAKNFIAEIESDSLNFTEHIDKVRKKKNKKFWANSGLDVLVLSHISEYFTDFTNAWSVMVFRLEVINETVCELRLRSRTYTY